MSELDERLRAIRERFENTRPRSLSNAIEWHSAYRDLNALLAALKLCREQRNNWFELGAGLSDSTEQDDAALAKILESGE